MSASGILFVVATPLGNLGDCSPRARETLAKASTLLCEDTRRTSTLLSALGIAGVRLERLDAHVEAHASQRCVERLLAGENLVLVSDAGTPAVSDPGAILVKAAGAAGVSVIPVPGPSAVVAAVSVSGLVGSAGFCFRGFLPRKSAEKAAFFKTAYEAAGECTVVFESPERLVATLRTLHEAAPSMVLCAIKEISKLHERTFRGHAAEILETLQIEAAADAQIGAGEWVLVLAGREAGDSVSNDSGASSLDGAAGSVAWELALQACLDAGVSASSAAKAVSQNFAVPKNQVYQRAISLAQASKKSSS